MEQKYIEENRKRKRERGDPWTIGQFVCVYCGKEIEWNPCCGHPECFACKQTAQEAYERESQELVQRDRSAEFAFDDFYGGNDL